MQVKHKNKLGDYPLHTACSSNDDTGGIGDVVVKLIELYPEALQHKNSSGLYPLHLAFCSHQWDDVLMKLIELLPQPIRKSSKDRNVLHFVCIYRSLSETLLTKLIEINPDAIQEADLNGTYPIYYAIQSGQTIAVIKLLLDGDPLGMQRKGGIDADDDETIFYVACHMNNRHLVQIVDLVEYLMQRSDFQINGRDGRGRTPLHYACGISCGHHEAREQIFNMIMNHPDVDVNALDSLNDTPLHCTILKQYKRYHYSEIILRIIQRFLDNPLILINEKNNDNITPLDLIEENVILLERSIVRYQNQNNDFMANNQNFFLAPFTEMRDLFIEFPIKSRWQQYCYYAKNFTNNPGE